jgi:acyl carrier protein
MADDAPAALSPHQDTILRLVRGLLNQEAFGVDDDVMEHGGNSLLVARLLWSVETTFGVEVSMRVFFDRPTAAGLADEVERLIRAELDALQCNDEDQKVR